MPYCVGELVGINENASFWIQELSLSQLIPLETAGQELL